MENANPTPADPKHDDNDNASVASDSALSEKAASVKSSASGIPKPSGIRPPSAGSGVMAGGVSRIGRPCLGQQKPGLPQMTPVKSESLIYFIFNCALFDCVDVSFFLSLSLRCLYIL